MTALSVEALRRRGLAVPDVADPRYHYRHAPVWDGVVHLSGNLPVDADGRVPFRGRVGAEVTLDEAREAARLCALQLVGVLDAVVGLDRIQRILRTTRYVMTAPGFNLAGPGRRRGVGAPHGRLRRARLARAHRRGRQPTARRRAGGDRRRRGRRDVQEVTRLRSARG